MVGSAEIADYPVVYCSNGFSELTGFKRSDVMKFSCDGRFLYSSSVKKDVTESVQTALRTKTSCQVEFIGNKKDGEKKFGLGPLTKSSSFKTTIRLLQVLHFVSTFIY